MRQAIRLYDLFGKEIRSRFMADIIRNKIKKGNEYELDFSGIMFISRSFSDELCELVDSADVKLSNMSGIVESMFEVVSENRKGNRIRETDNPEIKSFSNMESLSEYLMAMR